MLRLEFLAGGWPDCPFLRISGDDVGACAHLKQDFEWLADGSMESARLDELPGMKAIDHCHLTAFVGKRNRGVMPVKEPSSFDWVLTRAGWGNNAGLVEPFCTCPGLATYQWLDSPSDIAVLFSPSGQW
jgi:hypothetical protein